MSVELGKSPFAPQGEIVTRAERAPIEEAVLNAKVQTPAGAEDLLRDINRLPMSEDRRKALRDYALVVQKQERAREKEVDIVRSGYSLHLLPGIQNELPEPFVEQAYAFALEHGKTLKHAQQTEKGEDGVNEIVWKFPGKEAGSSFVLKLIQGSKMASSDHEMRTLQRANLLRLPVPRPLGMMNIRGDEYLMMEFVAGRSGMDIWDKLEKEGWSPEEIEAAQKSVERQMEELAKRFRTKMLIDKPWYIKDCLLTFDGKRITSVFPIDWERAHAYDPNKPDKIRFKPNRGRV